MDQNVRIRAITNRVAQCAIAGPHRRKCGLENPKESAAPPVIDLGAGRACGPRFRANRSGDSRRKDSTGDDRRRGQSVRSPAAAGNKSRAANSKSTVNSMQQNTETSGVTGTRSVTTETVIQPTTAANGLAAKRDKPSPPTTHRLTPAHVASVNQAMAFLGRPGAWLVQAAAALLKVKRRVTSRDWQRWFGSESPLIDPPTLKMLLKIGGNWALVNPKHFGSFPFSLPALYELSQLDRAIIEQGILDRTIRPGMTEAQAKEFVNSPHRKALDTTLASYSRFDPNERASKLRQFMQDEVAMCPAYQRHSVADLLLILASVLRGDEEPIPKRPGELSGQPAFVPSGVTVPAQTARPKLMPL